MLTIPKDLLDTLHGLRVKQMQDPHLRLSEYFRNNPLVLLESNLAAEVCLGLDGRVLLVRGLPPNVEVREETEFTWAAYWLVTCVADNEVPELLSLVPARPEDAIVCLQCEGRQILKYCYASPCSHCFGLGWRTAHGWRDINGRLH